MSKLMALYVAVKSEPYVGDLSYSNYLTALRESKRKSRYPSAMTSIEAIIWKVKKELLGNILL